MSNLSNLHISGSYLGLINLADSTQSLPSQSGDVNLQDGVGNNIGVKINATSNDVTIDNSLTIQNNLTVNRNVDINGDLDVSGSFVHSGSIDIKGNVTIDGDISANVPTFDTVNTRLLHVTEESASVIFSSGSNVIGDETSDTQTIVGQTTISGSLGLLNGTNLTVDGNISSSTISGIGNVTTYSASVDSRLDQLEGPFSTSVDSRLDSLESFETSQQARNSVLGTYTSSVDSSLASINSFTSSTDSSLNSINAFTSSTDSSLTSINSFTQSADTRITALENFSSSAEGLFVNETDFNTYTQSVATEQTQQNNRLDSLENFTQSLVTDFVSTTTFNAYTSSTDNKIDRLIAVTGSYATTGSNTFTGNNTFSGSVKGEVRSLSIVSDTASLDLSNGNFFTLTLPSGSTRIETSNIQKGQTVSLKLTQTGTGTGSAVFDSSVKFPSLQPFITTTAPNSIDIVTLVSYDTTTLFAVETKNLV